MELLHQLILLKMNIDYVKFLGYTFLALFIFTFIFFKIEEKFKQLHSQFQYLTVTIEKQQETIQNQRSLVSTLLSEREKRDKEIKRLRKMM